MDGKGYLTLEEFFQYLDEERRNRTRYQKSVDWVYRWFFHKPRVAVNEFFGNLVNRYQRSKYGIGYRDMWTFPSYFAGLLAHTLEREAEESFTYPGEERGFTDEEWKEYVRNIASALRAYEESFNSTDHVPGWYDDLSVKQERARRELHRFVSEFEYIGD